MLLPSKPDIHSDIRNTAFPKVQDEAELTNNVLTHRPAAAVFLLNFRVLRSLLPFLGVEVLVSGD